MTRLYQELRVAIAAGQTGIRIDTDELPDALETISAVCQYYKYPLAIWDRTKGMQSARKPAPQPKAPPGLPGMAMLAEQQGQPKGGGETGLTAMLAFLAEPPVLAERADDDPGEVAYLPTIFVFKNLNRAFERVTEEMISALQWAIHDGKDKSKFVIGLMTADAKLPSEIEPLVHVITHEPPDEAELMDILKLISDSTGDARPLTGAEKAAVCKAALGLTRLQAEGVFASCQVQFKSIRANDVWDHKAKILNREGLVEMHKTDLNFSNVGGLHGVKDFLKRLCAYDPLEDEDSDARAKGVVAVGPPGVGKSLLAYCLGNELGFPTLKANPGNLMDQYVGNTEKNTRRFFNIVKRMSPCIVVMDEVGQVMPAGGGDDNSGVSKRLLGTFLTMMNDIQEPVFWFFTSNDIESLHEAFLRAERVDAKVYIRLPDAAQRAEVWKIYLRKFFPPKVKEKDDPLHIDLDVEVRTQAYAKMKKVAPVEYGQKLAAALMCVPAGGPRDALLEKIDAVSSDLCDIVRATLIDDEGWTPAEIRSCCRLMRRLKLPLHLTSRRVGHVTLGDKGEKILRRLDRWAINDGALDAETGELFVMPGERAAPPAAAAADSVKRARRRIQTL